MTRFSRRMWLPVVLAVAAVLAVVSSRPLAGQYPDPPPSDLQDPGGVVIPWQIGCWTIGSSATWDNLHQRWCYTVYVMCSDGWVYAWSSC